jgi:Holliday junction resolvase RusA-like endonuclease
MLKKKQNVMMLQLLNSLLAQTNQLLLLLQSEGALLTGALQLRTLWLFPKGRSHKNGEWRITKPDTDNLQKLLKDCMTECGFWKDDALVCSELAEKFWADVPGIYVRIFAVSELRDGY